MKNFWKDHLLGVQVPQTVYKGRIVIYDPPPPALNDQAQSALSDIHSQAPMIVAMGESFGPQTQAYVKALQSIINAADTTSTELPAKPDKLTD